MDALNCAGFQEDGAQKWAQFQKPPVRQLLNEQKGLAPRARLELATLRLTAECSTIELPGNRASRRLVYSSSESRASFLAPWMT